MNQKLFTVGPVEMYPETLRLGGEQLPYFRTDEFSQIIVETETAMCELCDAPAGSKVILLTSSGTGAMEAAVINVASLQERVLILVGGSFGQRFCEICEDNEVPYDAIRLEPGVAIDAQQIEALDLRRYKALLVNAHETSTGVLYNLQLLGEACRKSGTFFVVDAISSFLCDPISMSGMNIDLLFTSSHKALALSPGISILVLGPRVLEDIRGKKVRSHYFAFSRYLVDAKRGQTPFTPAIGVILQLHERLSSIKVAGVEQLTQRTGALARHFRDAIEGLPFTIFPNSPSNGLTALSPTNGTSAYTIFCQLKSRFGLVVTPNGGALKHKLFRVGHMGNIGESDLDAVASALKEISQ
jgi:aspartate aminotransferase-like enzyme